jgi:hypothetical protein
MITRHHIVSAEMRSMSLRLAWNTSWTIATKKKSVPFPKRSKRSVISENASWRLSDASQYSRFGILMREAGNRNMKMIMTVNPAYRQKKVLRDDHPLGFPAPSKCEAIRSGMSGQ